MAVARQTISRKTGFIFELTIPQHKQMWPRIVRVTSDDAKQMAAAVPRRTSPPTSGPTGADAFASSGGDHVYSNLNLAFAERRARNLSSQRLVRDSHR